MARLARAYGSGPVSLSEVAEAENLSLAYLEQLIVPLRRAVLVESTRGAHGGYQLARDPSLITVGEIVRVLEGPIFVAECASEEANPGCCEREPECASRMVWQRMRDSITGVLDSITLADLCQEPRMTLDAPDGVVP